METFSAGRSTATRHDCAVVGGYTGASAHRAARLYWRGKAWRARDTPPPATAPEESAIDIIQAVFAPLYGKPCWQVQQGYSSFLTFEFGEPHLKINDPRPNPRAKTAARRRRAARRSVWVRGDWHLWLYMCDWTLYQGDRLAATTYSPNQRIGNALLDIDGQMLTGVSVSSDLRRSTFTFDLGGRIETVADDEPDKPAEQWMLFEPSGYVLTVRSDGCYHHDRGNTAPDSLVWRRYTAEAGG